MSYQFFHIETYSRVSSTKVKPSKPKAGGKTSAPKVKKPKATVSDVLAEVMREDGHCSHVESPQPPNFLYGNADTVKAIPLEIELNIEAHQAKHGGRVLRKDAHVLLAGVASFPREKMESDPVRYQKWKDSNLDFLKKKYGNNLKAVVEHLDEEHPHIHFYVISKDHVNAKELHDGYEAAKHLPAMTKEYNIEYNNAMRKVQNDYYEEVGHPLGLLRDGPKKKRLDRDVWKSRKTEADLRYQLDQVADQKRESIDLKDAQLDQELKNVPLVIESKVSELVSQRAKALEDNYKSKETYLEGKATKRTEGIERLEATLKERSATMKDEVKRQARAQAEPMAKRLADKQILDLFESELEPVPDAPKGLFSGAKWLETYDAMKHMIQTLQKKLAVSDRAVTFARETYEVKARESMKVHEHAKELEEQVASLLEADAKNGMILNHMKSWMKPQVEATIAHLEYSKASNMERLNMNLAKHVPTLKTLNKDYAEHVVNQYNLDIDPSQYVDYSDGLNMDMSTTHTRKRKTSQEK